MIVRLPLTLMLAAAVCFAVAVLIAATSLGGNFEAWLAGGLLACALSWLTAPFAPTGPPQ